MTNNMIFSSHDKKSLVQGIIKINHRHQIVWGKQKIELLGSPYTIISEKHCWVDPMRGWNKKALVRVGGQT